MGGASQRHSQARSLSCSKTASTNLTCIVQSAASSMPDRPQRTISSAITSKTGCVPASKWRRSASTASLLRVAWHSSQEE
ncbi:hypothetical protein BC831DRAFT_475271 [Entophlyctis helioformis]|nr:hypothetical protein BC831DRAFT_475271 [Entophlyctis helioformis]